MKVISFILKLVLAVFLIVLGIVIFVSLKTGKSNGGATGVNYAGSDKYHTGKGSVNASSVKNLEVNWISGSVTINKSGKSISFSESSRSSLKEEEELRWLLDGNTLKIQYCKSGLKTKIPEKDLVLSLPEEMEFDKVLINVVSADVTASSALSVKNLDINTVSGDASLRVNANDIKANSVSGDLILTLLEAPKSVKMNSVSGDEKLQMTKDFGFTANHSAVSGKFSSSLPLSIDGKKYTYGDGKVSIQMESISGSSQIEK